MFFPKEFEEGPLSSIDNRSEIGYRDAVKIAIELGAPNAHFDEETEYANIDTGWVKTELDMNQGDCFYWRRFDDVFEITSSKYSRKLEMGRPLQTLKEYNATEIDRIVNDGTIRLFTDWIRGDVQEIEKVYVRKNSHGDIVDTLTV